MRALTLYFRAGCSLCEAMIEEIGPYREALDFNLSLRDVDDHETWAKRYGTRVPLLMGEGEKVLCEYFLDPQVLHRYFEDC